jgi:hypothetical protein
LGDQARAILCADSKPPIQKHLPRRRDSLKNLHYCLCRYYSATPRCIGQTIYPTFADILGATHRLHQSCFVSQRFLFSWAVANEREVCRDKFARPATLFAVRSDDLKNSA